MSAVASTTAGRSGAARTAGRVGVQKSEIAFAALLVLGAALVLRETRGLSFFSDEWDFLIDRRGVSLDTLLRPHGPHLSLIPILIYKVLLQLFGASSYLPFRLLAAFDVVLLALVLGLVTRARWGEWWGLTPVLLLVTLGPAGSSLLWPFQCGYAIAVAAGVVALVAVGRGTRRGDAVACVALILSLASASQGVGFIVGATVMLVLQGTWRRRIWVVAVPAILYGLWYLKYGQAASETHLSLWKTSLSYAAQSLSATFAPLIGLSSVSPQTGLLDTTFGVPLALAAIAVICYAVSRGWRPRPIFWGAAATLLVLWTASSLSNTASFFRPPNDPRYLSTNAVLVLVCLCAAVRRPRLAVPGVILLGVVLAIVAATNASQYSSARASMFASDIASRAELGALLIMRGVVSPAFTPFVPGDPAVLVNVQDAKSFFAFVDSFGAITDSPATLLRQDESTREAADRELARGELSLSPARQTLATAAVAPTVLSGTARTSGGCLILGGEPITIQASPGRYQLTAGPHATLIVTMRRFAAANVVALGTVPANATATATVPADHAPQVPWKMMLRGVGSRVCAVPA